MPKLLLLSVSDCFVVYSGIIYFLVPPSCKASNSLDHVQYDHVQYGVVARDHRYFSGRAGTFFFELQLDPKAYSDYGQKSTSSSMLHFPLLLCTYHIMGLLMRHSANPGELLHYSALDLPRVSKLARRVQQVDKYVASFALRLTDALLLQYAMAVVRRVFLKGIRALHVVSTK